MKEFIDKAELYREIEAIESTVRRAVFQRESKAAELNVITRIKYLVADFPSLEPYDMNILQDWYQNSIDSSEPPIWTDEHLEELIQDFYLLPTD